MEDNSPLASSSEAKTTAVAELQMVLELVEELSRVVERSPVVGEIASRVTKVIQVLKAVEQEGGLGLTAAVSPVCLVIGNSENFAGFKKKNNNNRGSGAGEKKVVRRKRSHPYKIKKRSPTTEDGYTWRKYGQKLIHGAKYPRSYYRCTHKITRGCPARKQTQKSEDDGTTYHLIYISQHTCRGSPVYHQVPDGGGGGGGCGGAGGPGLDKSIHPTRCGSPIPEMVPTESDVGVPQATAMQSPTPAVPARQESGEQDVFIGTTHEYPPLSEQMAPAAVESSVPTNISILGELDGVTSGFSTTEALLEMLNCLYQNDM